MGGISANQTANEELFAANAELKQAEEAKKCFDNGVILDDKEGTVKKNLKKKISGPKISEPAGIDKPEDLPAPNTESQE